MAVVQVMKWQSQIAALQVATRGRNTLRLSAGARIAALLLAAVAVESQTVSPAADFAATTRRLGG